jgi:hypothetical protein
MLTKCSHQTFKEASDNAVLGQKVQSILDEHGGTELLLQKYEEIAAYNTNNYLPLVWRFYSAHRKTLFGLVHSLNILSTSADESVIDALKFVLNNEHKRGKYLPSGIELNFISHHWRSLVVKEVDGKEVLVRQQLEICIFSSLATEFKTGDACVVGSQSYADFRAQLLTESECKPLLEEYCQQLGFPADASGFVAYLQQELTRVAESVDKICSDGKQFTLNKNGEPVLKRIPFLSEPIKAAADGSKFEIYENNLHSEYHIRYGGYGGIAYHHVSDKYIALFTHFITCGVWEAVYILDGLLKNLSDIQPDTLYADTQGQSGPVFAISYLLGIKLMPRIRNWKDCAIYRPSEDSTYQYIDPLFKGVANWNLIKTHYHDLMRVVLSIKAGKVMP